MGQKISEKQMKEEIRSVVRQNIKEVTTNDWHYKAIMSIWDKGGSFTRKKIAAVLCNDPKADRRDVEDALRNSGYDEVTDVTDRLRIESIITEKQLKGLDGISSNTPLDKISKDQKLKIIKAPGNIIDFIVPKGVSRNFWQVIGTGKVKKNAAGEHYLEGRVIDSPMFKSIDDLIDGVQWDSMEERRRFNEGIIKEGEDQIPGGLAKGMTLNDIAEKHGMSVDMLVAEFKKGIQTEMEHTTDREMAKEITMDHLFEDPQYYTKLATVEEYVDDKGVEHVAAALPQTEEEPIKEGEDSEETLEGLKEMAMGDLERIADYANMILERMGQGQNLDSWMYSQITLAVDQLNSVHDTMDGNDGVKESVNEGAKRFYELDYGNSKYVIQYYDGVSYHSIAGTKQDAYSATPFLNKSQAEKFKKELLKKGYREDDRMRKESVNEYNVNKKFGSKYDIGAGSMGSGTIFWNRAEEEFGDYKKIAHVSDSGRITFYDKKLPSFVKKHVEDYAKTQNESINELTNNERQIKTGNPNNVFYVFYKGQFEAVYWAMNPSDLIKIYWDKFKVRRPAGSQFKLNPEFIIVPKKEYDKNTSNRYAKLKPYVDKFWDKLQNESVNEATEPEIIAQIKNIAKTHQNNIVVDPKSGKKMRVDVFSASAIATVYDALSDSNKEKFLASGLLGMQQMAMKLLKK
jgi:hypothetical protein